MTDTTTIRVSKQTRDILAAQAHEQGLSLAALLAEMADQSRRETLLAAEAEAQRIDALNPAAREELALWESTAAHDAWQAAGANDVR